MRGSACRRRVTSLLSLSFDARSDLLLGVKRVNGSGAGIAVAQVVLACDRRKSSVTPFKFSFSLFPGPLFTYLT
jgi:hypothetical protein